MNSLAWVLKIKIMKNFRKKCNSPLTVLSLPHTCTAEFPWNSNKKSNNLKSKKFINTM